MTASTTRLRSMLTVGALLRARGRQPKPRTPGLAQAVRCSAAAWWYLDLALAHLVLARRVTCGRAGPWSARGAIHEYVDSLSDDELDQRADELVAEAKHHAR